MIDDLVAPFEASPFYLVGVVAILLVLALWLGWRISRLKARPASRPPRVHTWQKKIDQLVSDNVADTRVFALSLAKLLRDYGTARTGNDMSSLSVTDIENGGGSRDFTELLRVLEHPSFSPSGEANRDDLVARAKAVVGSW